MSGIKPVIEVNWFLFGGHYGSVLATLETRLYYSQVPIGSFLIQQRLNIRVNAGQLLCDWMLLPVLLLRQPLDPSDLG
jgi:hypothetical protein